MPGKMPPSAMAQPNPQGGVPLPVMAAGAAQYKPAGYAGPVAPPPQVGYAGAAPPPVARGAAGMVAPPSGAGAWQNTPTQAYMAAMSAPPVSPQAMQDMQDRQTLLWQQGGQGQGQMKQQRAEARPVQAELERILGNWGGRIG